mmetsp:Transcript_139894/g.243634  ORF Transcript_139894/g.243634 Transcript_139894/m.243634 type:complete len:268 (-) Transcript_139894:3436-4239(-)
MKQCILDIVYCHNLKRFVYLVFRCVHAFKEFPESLLNFKRQPLFAKWHHTVLEHFENGLFQIRLPGVYVFVRLAHVLEFHFKLVGCQSCKHVRRLILFFRFVFNGLRFHELKHRLDQIVNIFWSAPLVGVFVRKTIFQVICHPIQGCASDRIAIIRLCFSFFLSTQCLDQLIDAFFRVLIDVNSLDTIYLRLHQSWPLLFPRVLVCFGQRERRFSSICRSQLLQNLTLQNGEGIVLQGVPELLFGTCEELVYGFSPRLAIWLVQDWS